MSSHRSPRRDERPTEITTSPPCVVFALAREAMAFWKVFPVRRRVWQAPCPAWIAGPPRRAMLVLEAGLGRSAMESAVTWTLKRPDWGDGPYNPPFLVLAGFSGALKAGREVGSLVLATKVLDEHGGAWPANWPAGAAPGFERGPIVTADALVFDPARKVETGNRYGALAVDMESATAARLCYDCGVPFGCLRAVSDDVDSQLSPTLVGLLRAGRPSFPGLLAAVIGRPAIVGELWRLARSTRLAARHLAAALDRLLPTEVSAAARSERPDG
jgi:adenosylhomocysteine nucleosidase